MSRIASCLVALAVGIGLVSALTALPVPSEGNNTITNRKNFIPIRRFEPLPGKVIGILVSEAEPALNAEGRTGPKDQLCFARNGCSYHWVYVATEHDPKTNLVLPAGEKGEPKEFKNVTLASLQALKPFSIQARYALVEIEVNDGLGCPACHSFAATKIKRLDGTDAYPLDITKVIQGLRQKYDEHLRDEAQKIDAAMVEAGEKSLKEERATGPRERSEVMFLTWLPDEQRLRAHFRTRVVDGAYKYAAGLNIELGGPVPVTSHPGDLPPARLPNGLRYGKQFGIEFGMAYEYSKKGEIERTQVLPIEAFENELPMPKLFGEKKK